MKANELMIGDYVSVKPSKMPIKIAAVHHKKSSLSCMYQQTNMDKGKSDRTNHTVC